MWLGEQIDEYGIGSGISLIIMAGIVAPHPGRDQDLVLRPRRPTSSASSCFALGGAGGGGVGFEKLIVLFVLFIAVVVAVVAITKGQRPYSTVQSAKHVRGQRFTAGRG